MTENPVSLYGEAHDLIRIESILERGFEILSQDQIEELSKTTNELCEILKEKTDSACYYDQSQEDFIFAIDNRITELRALKANVEKKRASFYKGILMCLDILGVKKITGKLYTISYRAPSKVVEILDENKLDLQFIRTKQITEVDKIAIKDALKEGKEVSGAILKDGKRSLSFTAGK